MPGLKRLSGAQLIAIFNKFDFEVISQKGSHVKLKRFIEDKPQTLTIPNHKEIDTGTLRAIYNQASKYIDPEELRKYFYSE
ncbi:MAG TPA: type II toxin-antitoxin system HicA family toxin [Spirochaetota bacterium]|nr:type II toxin-antitoxin system HicA family toxin [Spirochaetota bacterium]HPF07447.1 type II toxin-antitoxin system HicA family toxin [Spirochaetota bacterium]HPJ43542.1 type II toxin-antitoxin system HicA family toxin [Spirochaetota bacterium]HRX48929.1 type II toxin-antitoxin system HicA family toxin [Spirochaetota bacterium]